MKWWPLKKTKENEVKQLAWLAAISFLALFLELLVIRLVSTEIRIFAYVSNLVLLAVFIGSGLGMVSKKKWPLSWTAGSILALVWVLETDYVVRLPNLEFKIFSGITELLAPLSESFIWLQLDTYSKTGVVIGLGLTLLLFGLLMAMFVPIGSLMGEELDRSKRPLWAYSINIVFSLLGMWSFNGLSLLGVAPHLGLVLAMLLVLVLVKQEQARLYTVVALVAVLVMLVPRAGWQPYEKPVTFWSPYQKLTLSVINNDEPHKAEGWYLEVNNVGFMGLLDLAQETVATRMELIKAHMQIEPVEGFDEVLSNQYDLPYRFNQAAESVLIIGGGAGNDAAAALRAGMKKIKVVEIDPVIVDIGKKYHPEDPYADERVEVEVNDGRAYLERGDEKYDLIVMSLADSHTLSSSMTNLQLDNYLYTRESLEKAKEMLAENGVLFMAFEVARPWIGQRMEQTLTTVFGQSPTIFEVRSDAALGWGGVVFVVGVNQDTVEGVLAQDEELALFVGRNQREYGGAGINLLTDDWPYLYLSHRKLPILQIILAGLILASLVGLKRVMIEEKGWSWPFFMLGAGFMLYEFQNISRSSLLFGNTWVTNLFIITGVMVFILLANVVVGMKKLSLNTAIAGLLMTLLAQVIIPIEQFNQLVGLTKVVVAVGVLNIPHFFSAVIFAELFRRTKDKSVVFGSNLMGSAAGGLLEMLSYWLGIKSLLWVTISLYGLGVWGLQKGNSRKFVGLKRGG